jgi:hypothetical protein
LAHTRPVRLLVTLACASTAAAALPALAAGAPVNDNYLASTAINTAGSVLPGTSTRTGDIILATVQSDIL